jgi:hypothetical protein
MTIKPHIDYSWVPPQLKSLVGTLLGTLVLLLVLGLVVACMWWAAAKISGNFFIAQGRGGIAILSCLLAATLVTALPMAVTWGTGLDAIPQGVSVTAAPDGQIGAGYGPGSPLAAQVGAGAAQSLGEAHAQSDAAGKAWGEAKSKASHGDIPGAAGSAVQAGKAAADSVIDDLKAGVQIVRKQGVAKTLLQGYQAIRDKAGQTIGWLAGKVGL